ncbi:MAG: BON domain-containing protein [Anaerolineae bacterium]|nr:BON domain-containing protein [Anaerolineae bacterium]
MDTQTDLKRELEFLREQMHTSDQKSARLQNALDACEDCLESSGLTAMLHAARLERDQLNAVIMRQVDSHVLSLQAVILDQQDAIRQAAGPQAVRWQRGHATPATYWDAEIRQAYLDTLLRCFHAWQHGHSYYPPAASARDTHPAAPEYAYPWYPAPLDGGDQTQASMEPPVTISDDAIASALKHADCPADHLTIIAEPDGLVLATGYAHSEAGREQCLEALMGIAGVREVVIGVVIADPARCPACQAAQANGRARH